MKREFLSAFPTMVKFVMISPVTSLKSGQNADSTPPPLSDQGAVVNSARPCRISPAIPAARMGIFGGVKNIEVGKLQGAFKTRYGARAKMIAVQCLLAFG
ncbi:hypothetical protein HED55_22495 [Ochrobactrum haematophilum]|uniref:Uncharacterized protein n=1 Tax=Brucella haematophila TaxID=419474 RepID=A0ABX1DPR4_9HYPH|nr:hypothetical protein [Brucella haematophila]